MIRAKRVVNCKGIKKYSTLYVLSYLILAIHDKRTKAWLRVVIMDKALVSKTQIKHKSVLNITFHKTAKIIKELGIIQ